MPDVWWAIPSAKPADDCNASLAPWRAKGYRLAVYRDPGRASGIDADVVIAGPYRGWPAATNALCRYLLTETDAEFIVAGGDDMLCDPTAPAVIADQCLRHFGGSLGVMQPTGDPLGTDSNGVPAAARICGSPWMGREFIEKWGGGGRPFFEGFNHFFCDELLCRQLQACGLLWQRPDLTHWHNHWHRTGEPRPTYMGKAAEMWAHDERLFRRFAAAGFPAWADHYYQSWERQTCGF